MALEIFAAEYEPGVRVWRMGDDAVGTATEADALEQSATELDVMAPEMVEGNAPRLADDQRRGPPEFRVVAHREMQHQAAA